MQGKISTLAMVTALSLSACAPHQTVSRSADMDRPSNAGFFASLKSDMTGKVEVPVTYDVATVNVIVPRTLRVSEANSFHADGRHRLAAAIRRATVTNRCKICWKRLRPPAPGAI